MYDKLTEIKGIGTKLEHYFNNLGLFDVKDLLYYFPKDYEEYSDPIRISDVEVGKMATLNAVVVTKPTSFRKRNISMVHCFLDDGTARIRAYWFNIPFMNKNLIEGNRYYFRGKITESKNGFILTQAKVYKKENYENMKGTLTPIYGLTKGLNNIVLRKAIKEVVDNMEVTDYFDTMYLKEKNLCSLPYALSHIHFPKDFDDMMVARHRLVYDEFFIFSLAMLLNKNKIIKKGRNELKSIDIENIDRYKKFLDFTLTSDQDKVLTELINDIKNGKRLNRLIEGDVGSGKTIVAVLLAFLVVSKKMQVAFMAPTEVLAVQHFHTILNLIEKIYVSSDSERPRVSFLSGSTKQKERKEILRKLKEGEIDIIVGTHALFSKDVEYKDLGLAIIDEQHRFGVSQRQALENKSHDTNVIVMSATPIPRTLAMLLYSDLDISVLKEKPQNRLPIKNCVIGVKDREKGYKAIKKEIDKGHQAYVICPSIEASDDDMGSFANFQNVVDYTKKLKDYFGKEVKVEMLHGKMKSEIKKEIMDKFQNGEIDILVSTTVVEVGVDVKNATFIMIEDAGNFGLATLHQLRGRIGRGDAESYALFVDTMETKETKERLNILYNSNDGFYIAEQDLKLRGPGDIFGVKQSGDLDFRIGDIYTDLPIFRQASADAKEYIDKKCEISVILQSNLDECLKNGYTI